MLSPIETFVCLLLSPFGLVFPSNVQIPSDLHNLSMSAAPGISGIPRLSPTSLDLPTPVEILSLISPQTVSTLYKLWPSPRLFLSAAILPL